MSSQDYIEIRCHKDNRLLFRARAVPAGEIEIKCRRCGSTRRVSFPVATEIGKPASDSPAAQPHRHQGQQ